MHDSPGRNHVRMEQICAGRLLTHHQFIDQAPRRPVLISQRAVWWCPAVRGSCCRSGAVCGGTHSGAPTQHVRCFLSLGSGKCTRLEPVCLAFWQSRCTCGSDQSWPA